MADPQTNLPVLQQSTVTVLQRTQTTLGLLREVLQETSAVYWYERGIAASAAGEWTNAEYFFEQAVKLKPTYWQALIQIALVQALNGRIEKSVTALLESYEIPFPDWGMYINELSQQDWSVIETFFNLSNNNLGDEALFKRICLGIILILVIKAGLGNLVHEDGIWIQSKVFKQFNLISKSWELTGHLASIYNRLYTFSKSFEFQIEAYNQAIFANNKFELSYMERGKAKLFIKDAEGALQDFDQAILLNPSIPNFYMSRASAKASLEDYEGANADILILTSKLSEVSSNEKNYALSRIMGVAKDLKHFSNKNIDCFLFTDKINTGVIMYLFFNDFIQAKNLLNPDTYQNRLGYHISELSVCYNNSANLKYDKGDLLSAIIDYECAIKLDAKNSAAYSNLALAKERAVRKGNYKDVLWQWYVPLTPKTEFIHKMAPITVSYS